MPRRRERPDHRGREGAVPGRAARPGAQRARADDPSRLDHRAARRACLEPAVSRGRRRRCRRARARSSPAASRTSRALERAVLGRRRERDAEPCRSRSVATRSASCASSARSARAGTACSPPSGAETAAMPPIHAVCSTRTLAQRDPWVNMLRVTTQVFSAIARRRRLDHAVPRSTTRSAGRRHLAAASHATRRSCFATRAISAASSTRPAARTTSRREPMRSRARRGRASRRSSATAASCALERRARARGSTRLVARLARRHREAQGADPRRLRVREPRREAPLQAGPRCEPRRATARCRGIATPRRFEALRTRVEAAPPRVVAILLGPAAEHRASRRLRGGVLRDRRAARPRNPRRDAARARRDIACICGSRRALRRRGGRGRRGRCEPPACARVSSRAVPGALEAALREAGVDAFIFVGCDVVATLTDLVGGAA